MNNYPRDVTISTPYQSQGIIKAQKVGTFEGMTKTQNLIDRITDYFILGGNFNPENMDHTLVRELLYDCKKELTILSVVRDMFKIIDDPSISQDDKDMAMTTLREALK